MNVGDDGACRNGGGSRRMRSVLMARGYVAGPAVLPAPASSLDVMGSTGSAPRIAFGTDERTPVTDHVQRLLVDRGYEVRRRRRGRPVARRGSRGGRAGGVRAMPTGRGVLLDGHRRLDRRQQGAPGSGPRCAPTPRPPAAPAAGTTPTCWPSACASRRKHRAPRSCSTRSSRPSRRPPRRPTSPSSAEAGRASALFEADAELVAGRVRHDAEPIAWLVVKSQAHGAQLQGPLDPRCWIVHEDVPDVLPTPCVTEWSKCSSGFVSSSGIIAEAPGRKPGRKTPRTRSAPEVGLSKRKTSNVTSPSPMPSVSPPTSRGGTYSITLRSTGTVSVTYSTDLWDLSADDRDFRFKLIDTVKGYEARRELPAGSSVVAVREEPPR